MTNGNDMSREYREYLEDMEKTEVYLDRVRGSLIGGAVGDALGYAVEFDREEDIFRRYGREGIQEYELDPVSGRALISDDTQMSLFTAAGILAAEAGGHLPGNGGSMADCVKRYYLEWLLTQGCTYSQFKKEVSADCSWLMNVPELFAARAPGNTCLSAISTGMGSVEEPVNHSKGCGGVMRVAPLGMRFPPCDPDALDMEGAQLAALTHGHSLGYMPAAMLVHIVSRLVHDKEALPLEEIIEEAKATLARLFEGDPHLQELLDLVDLAVELAGNDEDDLTNIHRLGEGWVAEETLAIALYCSLKYRDDFSKALTVSVNHKGDSDSTGAVTGNIMGALHGYDAMDRKWKENLELSDVLLQMAKDLCRGCRMEKMGGCDDEERIRKD